MSNIRVLAIVALAALALGGCAQMNSPSFGHPKQLEASFNEIPRGVKEVALAVSVGGEVSEKNPAIAAAVERAFTEAFRKRGIAVFTTSATPLGVIQVHVPLTWQKNVWLSFAFFVNKFHIEGRVLRNGKLLTDPAWSKGAGCVAACPVEDVAQKLAEEVAEAIARRF